MLERSTYGVDGDGNLAMEDDDLEGFREFQEVTVYGRFVDNWEWDKVELCKEAEYWAILPYF